MTLIALTMCAHVVPKSYLDNAPIVTVPVVIHLYRGQTFSDVEKDLVHSQKKLSKGKIALDIISVDHNAPELGTYDVGTNRILDEKSISDQDEYLHIFFVKRITNSKKDNKPVGYHINWHTVDRCSSFMMIADNANRTTIAHEIGHELGLDHTDEKSRHKKNVMYPRAVNKRRSFTRVQIVKMRKEALERDAACKAKFQGLKI